MTPEIQYVRNGDVAVGYAVVGDGPVDVAYLAPFSNLEVIWESPLYARFLRSLGSFTRLIVVDRRGTGVSDRVSPSDLPPLEDLVDDLTAVLDAVGSERVVPFGISDSALISVMYASARPDRTAGLILHGATARGKQDTDYPWQWSEEEWEEYLATIWTRWGTPEYARESLAQYNPSLADDERALAWWGRFQRLSASPTAIYAMDSLMREMDIRQLLPAISVPTLILHREQDVIEDVGSGRYLAEQIPKTTATSSFPGGDHFPWAGDQDAVIDQIREFLAERSRRSRRSRSTGCWPRSCSPTWSTTRRRRRPWAIVAGATFQNAPLTTWSVPSWPATGAARWTLTGDGFFALFDGPARAVRCASAICSVNEGSWCRGAGRSPYGGDPVERGRRLRDRRRDRGADRSPRRWWRGPRFIHRQGPRCWLRPGVPGAWCTHPEGRPRRVAALRGRAFGPTVFHLAPRR